MLAIAQRKADEKSIDNITFAQSAIEDFSVADQSFGVVMGHSILHLVENKEMVISRVHNLLEPGGIFVGSTVCMASANKIVKIILPIGIFLGLLPLVKFFSAKQLTDSIVNAGFEIEYQWQPGEDRAVFTVAKKVG